LPDGSFKHDAEEWIIGLRKKARNGTIGVLQGYFLADGKGNLLNRADVRIVEDHTKFRGFSEVRNPGSCISCHSKGLNKGTEDVLRATLEAGVTALSSYKNKEKIESFNFSNLTPQLDRSNEDYAAIIKELCGCTPSEATAAFRNVINSYDRKLTINRAAWELGIEPGQLTNCIALANVQGANFPAQIARLAVKLDCPRVSFEPAYRDLNYKVVPTTLIKLSNRAAGAAMQK